MKKTIYVFNDGEFKRKDNTLYFETETEKKYLPVEDIKEIIVFGEVNLNKRLLEFLTKKEVILHFLNNYGYYIGSFYPREHYNSGYMILKQSEFYLRTDLRLNLAKRFIHGAVANINNVIRYYHNRGKEMETEINQITNLASRIDNCSDIETLMAVEGNIKEIYYTTFNTIIDKKDFVFSGRNKRPPQDRINALISFGNTLAYITVLSEIYKTHLDPRIGFLHATNFRRFTLNLDVAEIFKPILVDRLIFSLLGRNMLNKNNFESKINGILMNDKGRKIFVEEWENRLKATIKHRHLGRNVSYRSIIRMELYKLEKHLIGEKEYQPFISRW
ncbi:MAG: type I-B CRISPR-associated endonuclease Cas1 [Firmicutes bacterium]|nr:type I-B CRISPR-associated endonuclease Cas1 [Bacillota bacterium]